MKKFLLALTVAAGTLLMAGCEGPGETGDVESAKKAAAQAPKSADQLPADMPPQARAAAQSAMGQAAAAEQAGNDPGRVRAMQEMQKQHK
jgi:PBP1b-binding outer membrane lipoprotein LpoB